MAKRSNKKSLYSPSVKTYEENALHKQMSIYNPLTNECLPTITTPRIYRWQKSRTTLHNLITFKAETVQLFLGTSVRPDAFTTSLRLEASFVMVPHILWSNRPAHQTRSLVLWLKQGNPQSMVLRPKPWNTWLMVLRPELMNSIAQPMRCDTPGLEAKPVKLLMSMRV